MFCSVILAGNKSAMWKEILNIKNTFIFTIFCGVWLMLFNEAFQNISDNVF